MANRPPCRLLALAERAEGEIIISNYFNIQAIAWVKVITKPCLNKVVNIYWLGSPNDPTKLTGDAAKSFLAAFEQGESRIK